MVETLGMDIKQVHDVWKDTNLTWLQQAEYMPKQLDVPLTKSYLATLTFREALRAIYVGMQYLAVGLEQMVYDLESERSSFAKDLKDTTHKLRAVSLVSREHAVSPVVVSDHDVWRVGWPCESFKTTFETPSSRPSVDFANSRVGDKLAPVVEGGGGN